MSNSFSQLYNTYIAEHINIIVVPVVLVRFTPNLTPTKQSCKNDISCSNAVGLLFHENVA